MLRVNYELGAEESFMKSARRSNCRAARPRIESRKKTINYRLYIINYLLFIIYDRFLSLSVYLTIHLSIYHVR